MKLDMNLLREQMLEHLNSLWQEQYIGGGHKEHKNGYVSIMGTTDAAWALYMLRADEEIARVGKDACEWLLAQQKPDGHFHHDIPRRCDTVSYRHSDGHAFWMIVRTLSIYGVELPAFPDYLKPLRTHEALDRWFSAIDWQSADSNHHDVLALVPLLVSLNNPDWTDVYFKNLAAQQDGATAVWCNNRLHRPNISRTFAYVAIHRAAGLLPPRPDQLIDTVLAVQQENGLWETRVDFPEYHTMDAVYILNRLGNAIGYPLEPRLNALNRAADAMNAYFAVQPVNVRDDLHRLVANLHTVGLLQEMLPERYETAQPWRFDWDRADMFYSRAIAQG